MRDCRYCVAGRRYIHQHVISLRLREPSSRSRVELVAKIGMITRCAAKVLVCPTCQDGQRHECPILPLICQWSEGMAALRATRFVELAAKGRRPKALAEGWREAAIRQCREYRGCTSGASIPLWRRAFLGKAPPRPERSHHSRRHLSRIPFRNAAASAQDLKAPHIIFHPSPARQLQRYLSG
jgi:hypothetical protein